MRKSIAFKTLLRSPLKTILTFLLIAAASFALFSRVTDYAVTSRETAKAKSFYSGVAALDNGVVPVITENGEVFFPEEKPWPTDEKLEEFSSLPGVTLTDIRYTTDGLVEDYKRPIGDSYSTNDFIMEATYEGYEEYGADTEDLRRYLKFNDIKVYGGDIKLDDRMPMKILVYLSEEMVSEYKQPFSKSFFDELKEGGRYLVYGYYSERTGTAFQLDLYDHILEEGIIPIDGLGDDYLETEEFAWYKKRAEAITLGTFCYDIVYTSNMRAIPYVNERRLLITQGSPLTAKDTDGCVVSEEFLEMYGLSIGDKINIQLGDKFTRSGAVGTRSLDEDDLPNFIASAELEIIGVYRDNTSSDETFWGNEYNWRYGPGTVFVASSLLPIEVPEDYELLMNQFSVFIENPRDIEAFREAAEPMVAEMGLGMRFSDGGWSGMKDNIETGSLTSFLTTALYVLGAALALFLAVYLYIGRNKESYAIMRMLGVSGRRAGNSVVLPFLSVAVFAMAIGGVSGLFYASYTAQKTLARMSDSSAPEGYVYVLNASLPAGVVILCLVLELLFIAFLTLLFLSKMKKMPPLELLHAGTERTGAAKKTGILRIPFAGAAKETDIADTAPLPAGLDMARLSAIEEAPVHGKYNAFRQVCAYIQRHMRRGMAKTAVSLVLTVVLAAGVGTFVLARLTYHDACQVVRVQGRATNFASSSLARLLKSDLVKDVYYYDRFDVRVNGVGVRSAITFTNDLDQYLIKDYKVTYAEGYDESVFDGTGPVCLVEQTLAEKLGVSPGDEITMMSEDLYQFMPQVYEEDMLEFAIERAGKPYKVVGILETEDDKGAGIFSVVNDAAQRLYGQAFAVGYCEFTLTDNGKIAELDSLLEQLRKDGMRYVGGMASFHIDSELLKNAERIRDLLDSLFPIAVAAALLIGLFGPGLVIMQLAQEAAFLRILGVTKKRARCMLVFEQIILCIVGIALVAGVLVLFSPGQFIRSIETLAFCWMLYFLGCVCGALAAAIQVTRHRVLELLQVKE